MVDSRRREQGRRAKMLRLRAGFATVEDVVAKNKHVSIHTLKAYENGKRGFAQKPNTILDLYKNVQDVTEAWLLTGANPPPWALQEDIEAAVPQTRMLPQLTTSEAITMPTAFKRLDDAAKQRGTTVSIDDERDLGARAFAWRVEDDSMVSPDGKGYSFSEGQILIFDPDQQCKVGDFVLAQIGIKGIFRRLVEGDILRALNRDVYGDKRISDKYRIVARLARRIEKF